jgi:hypothetical protein
VQVTSDPSPLHRVAGLLVGLSVVGCAAEHAAPPPPEPPAETHDTGSAPDPCADGQIEVTGGFARFGEPFIAASATGNAIVMTYAPEVGWLLETAIRVTHVHAAVGILPIVQVVADGRIISGAPDTDTYGNTWNVNQQNLALLEDGACSGYTTGIDAYLIPEPGSPTTPEMICPLAGSEVEVRWEVEDLLDGRTGSTSVRGILELDPYDVPRCAAY